MINVAPVQEPPTFDERCRQPGNQWLADHPDLRGRPRDYWSPFRPDLEDGYRKLCGYAAMRCPSGGTIDHWIAYDTDPSLAYEWTNYRFASTTMNNIKRTKDDKVLDPHKVLNGWFEIILPSLQMRLTDAIPDRARSKAQYMLDEMRLGNDERIVRWRQSWYELYEKGELSLKGLRRVAPLIAEAVDRRIAAGT